MDHVAVRGLAQVGAGGDDQPEVVVAEPLRPLGVLGGEPRPTLSGEREELVPGVPVGELQLPELLQPRLGEVRLDVGGGQGVLGAVARPHAPSQARLVSRNEA